jgi:hypothetical protein
MPWPRLPLPLSVEAFQRLPRGAGTFSLFRAVAIARGDVPSAYASDPDYRLSQIVRMLHEL